MIKYPNDADGDALTRIAADGVDMSIARIIEFAIDAPNESSSNLIKRTLADHGYDAETYYDEGEFEDDKDEDAEEFRPSWTVYAIMKMIPEYYEIVRIQAELDRLAKPHGGKSDGWGTLVE